ncbi:atp-binding cassette superfamily [Plasmopara halstedii]|uniref:Atp-binding cassette superfamily n=1 Tax=Plasmopara halstedii TaxID=4781 RepID=A0A0P1ALU3_PLAHL|nr:atp-binding cassette superfamily [Plasmopara halstedii]CEG42390.1 atp-binding cassette superfamily [Plasmopara halstedii]|eukprot:XP_024578759.1 atp-binding cassette superfamily [Plasmopara halstedii]
MTRFSPTGFLVSSSLFITPVLSYEAYVIKVPNGANVDGVKAIGHTNSVGGGARNAFGTDFDDASHTWTTELCIEDSDGDGQTNGEELGDPCCEWTSESAKAALWSSGVSNPGDAARKTIILENPNGVLTNDPPLHEQLQLLIRHLHNVTGTVNSSVIVPGGYSSTDRFVRLSVLNKMSEEGPEEAENALKSIQP